VHFGPDHFITSLDYFQVGQILVQLKKTVQGEAFFAKIAEIWYKYLKNLFQKLSAYEDGDANEEIAGPGTFLAGEAIYSDEMVQKDACNKLQKVLNYFEEAYTEQNRMQVHRTFFNIYRALALLFKYDENEEEFQNFMTKALDEAIAWKGEDSQKAIKLRRSLESEAQNEDVN